MAGMCQKVYRVWRCIFFTITAFACFSLPAENAVSNSEDFSVIAEKTLDETWSLIIKRNFKDKSSDESWLKIYNDARPGILNSKNSGELLSKINGMISKLGQSHMALLPPVSSSAKKALTIQRHNRNSSGGSSNTHSKKVSQHRTSLSHNAAGVGLRTCVVDNKLCVLSVSSGSSADAAGIKMGDVITSIHGFHFDLSSYTDYPWDMIADSMLNGTYGSSVKVGFYKRDGEVIQELKRTLIYGPWIKVGAMPKISGIVESKILPGNVGYIYLSPCFPQQVIKMHQVITGKLEGCRGIIIDLRNNPGGIMFMAPGMAGWLSDKELEMGRMETRECSLKLKAYPQQSAFTGPLAVLINHGTFSTAEVFAAGIQDNGRGKIFGETSGGKCLPSLFFLLSTEYRLQTVFGDFTRINGKRIEGKGVKADVPVSMCYSELSAGKDSVCEAARLWILKDIN